MTVVRTKLDGAGPADDDVRRHPGRRMSEQEFVAWVGEKTRAEWVDGEVILMAPVSTGHDSLGGWARVLLQMYVEHRELGNVYGPELTVRLPKQRRRRLPDLMFIYKEHLDRVRTNHVEGPPDLIMEIVSPDSVARDWREKFLDYERAAVREYWILDASAGQFEAYALSESGKYERIPERGGRISSAVVKGFYLRREWVTEASRPKAAIALREMGVRL